MAEPAAPRSAPTARVRWGILVALRTAACGLLLLALYRAMMLLGSSLQNLSTGHRMFPSWDQNHAVLRAALAGLLLLLLSAWIAARIVPAASKHGRARYWARVGIRAAAAAALLLAAWTAYTDARDVWERWEFMRSGAIRFGSSRTGSMAPPTALQSLASAAARARPSAPLLVLGLTLLAVQQPLVRLLTPRFGGCPKCGYAVDPSKQERCPECGLALQSSDKRA